jgi:hypothetical protein
VLFYSLTAPDTARHEGQLGGYRIVLVGSYGRFKQLVTDKFGRPTGTTRNPLGELVTWEWPTITAVLSESCVQGNPCLTVRTRELAAQQAQRDKEQNRSDYEKAKKAF